MHTVRYHAFVRGRVQGVFFRETARRKALELGVGGWIRNLPDGRVEAVFEGRKSAVQTLLSWCRQGPETAQVLDVETAREEPTGQFSDFRIVG